MGQWGSAGANRWSSSPNGETVVTPPSPSPHRRDRRPAWERERPLPHETEPLVSWVVRWVRRLQVRGQPLAVDLGHVFGEERHPIAVSTVSWVSREQAEVEVRLFAGVGRIESLEPFVDHVPVRPEQLAQQGSEPFLVFRRELRGIRRDPERCRFAALRRGQRRRA